VIKSGQQLRIYKSRRKEDLEKEEEAPEVLDQAWFNDRVIRQGGMDEIGREFAKIAKLMEQYEELRKKNGSK
jgi:hypothetical protein